MSITNLNTTYNNLTIDGLVSIDANDLSINGQQVNLSQYVPYIDANTNTDLGAFSISSSAAPTALNNLTNKNYVDSQNALRVPYSGANANIDLGTFTILSSTAPSTSNNLTNKNYVDTQDALKVPYTGATSNVVLTGTNKFQQAYNALTSDTTTLVNRQTLDSAISGLGAGILNLNNTWTGTNQFNNNITTGDGYTNNFGDVVYTGVNAITSGTPTTTGITAAAPTPIGTLTFSSPTYTMTPSGASTFACFWSSATFTPNFRYFFTFTNATTTVYAPTATLTVCQANTANSGYVAISSAYSLPSTATLFSGYFTVNLNASYTGQIFFILSNVKFTPFTWTAFTFSFGALTVQGGIIATGIATDTPTTTIGLNSSNQLVKYANPINSVSINYIPYASSTNVLSNSIMYQSGTQLIAGGSIYASGDIGTGTNINAVGVNCSVVAPSAGYIPLDDRSLTPKHISAGTEQFFFGSWNNNSSAPFADCIGMNSYTDSTGGNTNVLMVRKDTFGIRQYQGAFGSTTPFSSTYPPGYQYMDVCMKGVADGTMTEFTAVGGTWNQTLWVGSGTDKGTAQVICTDGNLHLDPRSGHDIYLGYYRNPNYIYSYATYGIVNYTRYINQYADVNGDAAMYLSNANNGTSSYYNLIIHESGGNTNHFMNSATRTADGGVNTYTIRNDTSGGVRFLGQAGGFSSYGNNGGSMSYNTNAIVNYTNTTNNGGGGWNNQGYTLFCNTSTPSINQPALALGCSNTGYATNFITSLYPGIVWTPLQISAGTIAFYLYGVPVGYTVPLGGSNVSDEREKLDIKDLKTTRSLERVLKCKPKYYKRKYYDIDADGNPTTPAPQWAKDTICIGLLAQDVREHNPHCISTWKNDYIKPTDDDDGMRLGMNYNDYIIHVIGAVQEQQKQIQDLREFTTKQNDVIKQLIEKQDSLEEIIKKQNELLTQITDRLKK